MRKYISILPYSLAGTITVPINSLSELADTIKSSKWCMSTFFSEKKKNSDEYKKLGHRKKSFFKFSDFIAADFDDGLPLSVAVEHFKDYQCLIYTTKSHQKEKNGKIYDRYRIILVPESRIFHPKVYSETWKETFGNLNPDFHCSDSTRFYNEAEFKKENDGFKRMGTLVFFNPKGKRVPLTQKLENKFMTTEERFQRKPPKKYKKISEYKPYPISERTKINIALTKKFGKMDFNKTKRFLKVLSALPLDHGYNISINKLARTLNCEASQASRLLKKAIEAELLKVTNHTTSFKTKAISYIAINPILRSYISVNKKNKSRYVTNTCVCRKTHDLDLYGTNDYFEQINEYETIKSGRANATLLWIANKVRGRPDDFWDFVATLEGMDLNDRLEQAERIINYAKDFYGQTDY